MRRSSQPGLHPSGHARSWRRRLNIRFAKLMLWLHIYVSMFGLATVLFFSVTGITLNHPKWFFGESERLTQAEGQVNREWLHVPAPGASSGAESDPSGQVAKLEVVEHLRRAHGVRGALADFRVDPAECTVSFKGPGYAADAFIDRDTGHYNLTETYHGFVAVINDLHKGRDTGPVWSVIIDVSAVLLTIISLTGLTLLFYLKLRRRPGLVVSLIGTIVLVAIGLLWVP
ncbi:MAG TPA: PepSY-associated TM helix domain-containing protein [Isosphaeraceae bacterium]|nr:PepSY-associated TM helix domain-containing protein [Isosphaeraceae bacterium]